MLYLSLALEFFAIFIVELLFISILLTIFIHYDNQKYPNRVEKTISDLKLDSESNAVSLILLKIVVFAALVFMFYADHMSALSYFGAICLIFMAVLVFYKRILNSQPGEKGKKDSNLSQGNF